MGEVHRGKDIALAENELCIDVTEKKRWFMKQLASNPLSTSKERVLVFFVFGPFYIIQCTLQFGVLGSV